jgi:hypothetical protein
MAFAASSLMVGTASAAKAPKPPKPIKVSVKEMNRQMLQEPVGKAELEYTATTVTLKSISVHAVKKKPVLTPGKRYDVAMRLDGVGVTFCTLTAPKNGTAGKCAKAKPTDSPSKPNDNLISADYAGASIVQFGIWPSEDPEFLPEVGALLKSPPA